MTIKFKKLNEKAKYPEPTPSGFDLYAPNRVDLKPNDHYTIGSGIAVDIPEGIVGMIVARSKMALKTNIQVSAQIIHHVHKDEIQINLYNAGKDLIEINANDKVAQLIFFNCITDYVLE